MGDNVQVIDFPLHFPTGTTTPGGIMVPVSLDAKLSAPVY